MNFKFFFISAELAKTDPTTIGYAYAKQHQSEWVSGSNDLNGNLTSGSSKGIDNVIHDNKAYLISKLYFDIDSNSVLIICVESVFGCDTKLTFNN